MESPPYRGGQARRNKLLVSWGPLVIFDFRSPSPGWPPSRPPSSEEFPPNGRCRSRPTICLGRAGDACVLGVVERAGNALYSARVYVELGRRLAHAHAARQSRPDSPSQLIRDRRPAKALTFTLGPL